MRFEIHVKGHLHHRWSTWLYDSNMIHLPDGSTSLTGDLPDDAAVYGLLFRLRDMGLPLLSVTVLEKSASDLE